MADIRPFQAVRPQKGYEQKIAALPYDVYNRQEAKEIVSKNPFSFLKIDRAETNFPDNISTYDDCVYEKAAALLKEMTDNSFFVKENKNCYYIYRLQMGEQCQTGIVACASIYDYENGVIMKHENTRAEKEQDRIRHIDTCNAQTGPIFLAYRKDERISDITRRIMETAPLYDFCADDTIRHSVWIIDALEDIQVIQAQFQKMKSIYIADGHHRCASAVKVGMSRRKAGVSQESDYFMSVLFPDEELKIYDYNRVIKDLNNKKADEIIHALAEYFIITEEKSAVRPSCKGTFGMFLEDKWYLLALKEQYFVSDPVMGLDVSYLQNYVLQKIFGIDDPKTDKRIDFVGGIRGLKELERRVHTDAKIAFSMYPTTIEELFKVADAGRLMPPKSTWFEPKLRSGLFIHLI